MRRAGVHAMLGAALSAVLLVACGDNRTQTEPTGAQNTGAPTTTTTTTTIASRTTEPSSPSETGTTLQSDLTSNVDVSIACSRGSLIDLPFEPDLAGLRTDLPDETSWVREIVTITNNADRAVQVEGGFVVEYLAADGSALGKEAFLDPFPPAFWAASGQTIQRTRYSFNVSDLRIQVRDLLLAGKLFAGLDSCEVVGGVAPIAVGVERPIDPQFADETEQISCGLSEAGDRFEAVFRIANPGDEPVTMDFAFEILDENGDRLGLGGNVGDEIQPSGRADIIGWAAFHTVVDIDRAQECALLQLSAR
ncbi:MAG: hypothetical protein HKN80_10705 [Acidimicrobiia bacterium]|nr:hypothetical protein [Acidimicrobiia bacterium]